VVGCDEIALREILLLEQSVWHTQTDAIFKKFYIKTTVSYNKKNLIRKTLNFITTYTMKLYAIMHTVPPHSDEAIPLTFKTLILQ
jgi:hypothetical protein